MRRLIAALGILLLASCAGQDLTERRKIVRESSDRATASLRNKIDRLALQYAGSQDNSETVARAVVAMCEREIREVVDCAVEGWVLDHGNKPAAVAKFRDSEDERVRKNALENAIAKVVTLRTEKTSKN